MNPSSAQAVERVDALDADRVKIDGATIQSRDRQTFLRTRKEFRRASVRVEEGALAFVVQPLGPDVSARMRFLPAPAARSRARPTTSGSAASRSLECW